MMILIRLLMKVLLLPVLLVLTVLKIFFRLAANAFSFIVGLLTLYIFVCLVMTIMEHQWGNALILFLIESGVVLATVCPVLIEDVLDTAGAAIGTFMRL